MRKRNKPLSMLLLVALMAGTLTACTGKETAAPAAETASVEATTSASADNQGYKEAPILAEQVAAGTLAAVEERLPVESDIMIEQDVVSIGTYGGSLTLHTTDNGRWSAWGPVTEQGMFRFKQDGSGEAEANVCKDFYSNDDATVWTLILREGMRWSDGEPFTADDVIFYYNHMSTPALNEDRSAMDSETEGAYSVYTSKAYSCYQAEVDGVSYWAEFTKISDYELTVTFAAPKPSFPEAAAVDNKWMFLPKHFYINYVSRKDGVTDDASFPYITEAEAIANANRDFGKQWESYSTMGKDIGYYHWDYAIVPQVRGFIAVKDNWDTVGETYTLVRNPYFWKTDSEGNQLPYLDSIDFKVINEQDQITLTASAGEFDFYSTAPTDYSVVATALKDTYSVNVWYPPSWSADQAIRLNQTVKNLDKRALFQDIRFREALSIGVDRDLLNETLANGMSRPRQASVPEGLYGYDEEWAVKWTEYDVDRANALLDEITEPWDQASGTYRKMLGTSKDLEIIVSIKEPSSTGDFFSLLQSAYKAIGVKLSDTVDADYRNHMLTNDVEAVLEAIAVSSPAIRPDAIVPMRNTEFWYSAYGKWYEDGKTEANGGIEPTGDVMELVIAYETLKSAVGENRNEIIAESVQKIYDLHKENIWIIGYLEAIPSRILVRNTVHNIPENLMMVDEFRFFGLGRPEQFWIEQ